MSTTQQDARRRYALLMERYRSIACEAEPDHPEFGYAFMRYYLGHYMRIGDGPIMPPAQWHHDFMGEVFGTLRTGHAGAYLAPRGYAKSTIVSLTLPLVVLARRLKHYIWLIEDTGAQAKQAMQSIISELDGNHRIQSDFPHLRPKKDHRKRPVADRDNDVVFMSDQRLQALGAGQKLRGRRQAQHRPDLVLIDDLENDESVATKYQRDKLDMWLSSAVMGALGPQSDVYLVGTLLHYDAVLARLMKREGWSHRRYEAVRDHDDFSTSTWPEFWTQERLADQKLKMGSRAFAREVLHQTVNEDEQLFKPDFFKRRKPILDPQVSTIRIAVDPATGEKNTSDYSAIVVVARNEARIVDYDVVDVWRGRVRGDDLQKQIKHVVDEYAAFRPVVIVESVQAQVWAAQALQARGLAVRTVHPHHDKILRAEPISVLYEQGSVYHALHLKNSDFELELEQFPASEYDDQVDALVYALSDLALRRVMRLRAVG